MLSVLHRMDPNVPLDNDTEMDLWRDSHLCESYATSAAGLALAALRRGFKARIVADRPGIGFDRILKEHFPLIDMGMMRDLYDHTVSRARSFGIEEVFKDVGMDDIRSEIERGILPIVMISTALMDEDVPIPHWVIVFDVGPDVVEIANPETAALERYPSEKFEASLGYQGYKAMVAVWR